MNILKMLAIVALAATGACVSSGDEIPTTQPPVTGVAPTIHPGPDLADTIDRAVNSGAIADGGDIETGGQSDGTISEGGEIQGGSSGGPIHPSPEVRDAISDALHGDEID